MIVDINFVISLLKINPLKWGQIQTLKCQTQKKIRPFFQTEKTSGFSIANTPTKELRHAVVAPPPRPHSENVAKSGALL